MDMQNIFDLQLELLDYVKAHMQLCMGLGRGGDTFHTLWKGSVQIELFVKVPSKTNTSRKKNSSLHPCS